MMLFSLFYKTIDCFFFFLNKKNSKFLLFDYRNKRHNLVKESIRREPQSLGQISAETQAGVSFQALGFWAGSF